MISGHLEWLGDMQFDTELNGHHIILDTDQKNGGQNKGPRPKGLLLNALLGCSGMDVVSLFKKMNIPFTSLEMDANASLNDDHPFVFTEILMIYTIKGPDKLMQHKDNIIKAIKLSYTKYCGVAAMLKKNSPIKVKALINTEEIIIEE